jgi:hypothetical protein
VVGTITGNKDGGDSGLHIGHSLGWIEPGEAQ